MVPPVPRRNVGLNQVLQARQSGTAQRSISSGSGASLERVSVAIQKELQGAKWRIERKAFTLGARIGKGGFGEVHCLFRGCSRFRSVM